MTATNNNKKNPVFFPYSAVRTLLIPGGSYGTGISNLRMRADRVTLGKAHAQIRRSVLKKIRFFNAAL